MREAIYNSRSLQTATPRRLRHLVICLSAFFFLPVLLRADDLAGSEQQLARKIAAITGPGAVALTVENRSSLTAKETDTIRNELRAGLESLSVHIVVEDQAAASVSVTLSENPQSYVWAAMIRLGSETSAALVSLPRPERSGLKSDSFPITLRKTPLWEQAEPILDVVVLQETPEPTEVVVLDTEAVTFYVRRANKWTTEQRLPISHVRPWPRDPRGRLLVARDRTTEVYLPGVRCGTTKQSVLALDCRNSDDPWPIGGAEASGSLPQSAFYTAKRNFFTGDVNPHIGKFATVPKFYSAAAIPRAGYSLWLFSGTDGLLHMVDGISDQPWKLGWGSDIAAVKSPCGSGWTLLATGNTGDSDFVKAYDFPDREPMPVSAPLEMGGVVTALWISGDAGSAIVATRNRETGKYAAYRLQVACSQ